MSRLVLTLALLAILSCSRVRHRAHRAAPQGDVRARIALALRAMGPGYRPRTRHLNADGSPKHTNRLILEASPYLRQHAHNPVEWFPWGPEAFARARALNRPIFLSVGYSTCHWCHVMEEESFEDPEVAAFLNAHYVPVKVDREERPDLDGAYMTFLQSMTGQGGWPMSLWLTPARDPFFAGTYYPPRAGLRGSRRGFLELLREQHLRFAASPGTVAEEARRLAAQVRARNAPEPVGDFPSAAVIQRARREAAESFDPISGGRGGAPKFPSSFPLRLLLRSARRGDDDAERARVALTLERMRAGGIYDHLAGGFHRYATDSRWLIPHFEKMLYDNARLALAYLEGAQATGEQAHADTARETLDYLLREMRSPEGTFYSATDADSPAPDGRRDEGRFFTWTASEVSDALGADDAAFASRWYDSLQSAQIDGRSMLFASRPRAEVAAAQGLDPVVFARRLTRVNAALLERRLRRPPPLRDEKVLVAWNALALSAFARAAIALGDPRYADAARLAAERLTAPLRAGGPLPHYWSQGRARGRAFADDVVYLAAALIDVFELTAETRWLELAISLSDDADRRFVDPQRGDYFLGAAPGAELPLRERSDYDGPVPSVSAVAAMSALRLHGFTAEGRFQQRAEMILRAFTPSLQARPLAHAELLLALDWATDVPREVVIALPSGQGATAPSSRAMLDALRGTFAPNTLLVVASESELDGALGARVPWARGKRVREGVATAYVCERGRCELPTTRPETLAEQLSARRPYP